MIDELIKHPMEASARRVALVLVLSGLEGDLRYILLNSTRVSAVSPVRSDFIYIEKSNQFCEFLSNEVFSVFSI